MLNYQLSRLSSLLNFSLCIIVLAFVVFIKSLAAQSQGSTIYTNGIHDADPNYVEQLIRKADQLGLYKKRYWYLLLHYTPDSQEDTSVSEVDGLGFFFSADGQKNPRAELHATLWAFFESAQDHARNMHPQCQFPARFQWLKKELNFDTHKTPTIQCPGLELWLKVIDYDSVSLVFASHFLNSPGSAFGHTLIKINNRKYKQFDLLSYAINYAAIIGEIDAFRYALYGLFGGFIGRFSFLPYHAKVRQYNDIESRGIWEYRLNLNKEEIQRMLLHTWELEHAYFSYYFLRENCGYHILSLLEIARPHLNLRSEYILFTPPGETTKLLFENNLVKWINYRPSEDKVLLQRIEKLDSIEKEIFFSVIDQKKKLSQTIFAKLPLERRIYILDTLLSSLRPKTEFLDAQDETKKYYQFLIQKRIELPPTSEHFEAETKHISPHLSHLPSNIKIVGGSSSHGSFIGMRIYPGVHEFLSVSQGYPQNSELLVLETDLRWYEEQKQPNLYQLSLLKMTSLVPYEPYKKSMSYTLNIGMESEFIKKERESQNSNGIVSELEHVNVGIVEYLLGPAFRAAVSWNKNSNNKIVFAAMMGGLYRYGPGLTGDRNHIASPAIGAILGWDFGLSWRLQLQFKYYPFALLYSDEADNYKGNLGIRYSLERNLEALLEFSSQKNYNQIFATLSYFF